MLVAPSITWLFVSTSPFLVSTMPVPAPATCWYWNTTLMSTMPGSTLFRIAVTLLGDPGAELTAPDRC
jgi:hypothetical protein